MPKPLRRRPPERALAWLYTGPLGHLYGALADIGVMWVRYMAGRVRGAGSGVRAPRSEVREPGSGVPGPGSGVRGR